MQYHFEAFPGSFRIHMTVYLYSCLTVFLCPVLDEAGDFLDHPGLVDRASRFEPGVELLRQVNRQPGLLPTCGPRWRPRHCRWLCRCRAFLGL